jgi:glutathione S-transferase
MAIKMYDLAGADANRRFSPFCWRTRMALAHKGLEAETIPWRYADKPKIAFANWDRVPVIVDDGKPVADSWAIAGYLEEAYPERPSLFGGAAGKASALFVNQWADGVLNPAIARIVALDILNHLEPGDKDYFRKSREARFGATLEEFCAGREKHVEPFRKLLEPLRGMLAAQPFLGGESPLYPDYIVFGSLQWPRCVSEARLLESSDPVNKWRERLLDAFGGLARNAPGYW